MTRGRFAYWLRQEALGPIVHRLLPLLYIAAYLWRRVLVRTTFIAVTGSLGKTTTKECLAAILATHGATFRSYRNQNGLLGVTLNLLRVRPWHRFAVLEVAAAAPGMMRRSARAVRPHRAILLNVLRTHTTAFRDLEQHAEEKQLLLRGMAPDGLAVLNVDDPLVRSIAGEWTGRSVSIGVSPGCDYQANQVSAKWPARLAFLVRHELAAQLVETQLVGTHWLHSALAALAAASELGVELGRAADALRTVEPFPGRLQPVRIPSGAVVLRDDYNASIDTIEASARVLEEATAARRILVITDMSDFGRNRKQRLKYLAGVGPRVAEVLVLVGEIAEYGKRRAIDEGMRPEQVHTFPSIRTAAEFLRQELKPGDLMLLKGRTTDHAARILFAQLGPVGCWKEYCPKRMLCDICWELRITPGQLSQAVVVRPDLQTRA